MTKRVLSRNCDLASLGICVLTRELRARRNIVAHEELLTIIRELKEARRVKHEEEKKEEVRLEELKLRLCTKLNHQTLPSSGKTLLFYGLWFGWTN